MNLDLDAHLDLAHRAADVPAGEPFDAWCVRALSITEFAALGTSTDRLSPAQLAYLAWLGNLAPSTHNAQPVRFQLLAGEGAITLWIDRERVLPESDPVGRQSLVSVGAAAANIALGAACMGWHADLAIGAPPSESLRPMAAGGARYTRVAELRFRAGAAPLASSWLTAMLTRKVVRAEFDRDRPLDPDLPAALSAIAAKDAALELHLISDAITLHALGKGQEIADTTVINRDRFSIELGHWLHEDASPERAGMRGAEFGLSAEATRRMRLGLLREGELLADETAAFAKTGNIGMRSSPAVAVITVTDDNTHGRVAAGHAYQEMALLLEQRGLRTAMHAAMTEVEAPNLALRGRLRTRRRPTVIFRIGTPLRESEGQRPHSSRPHLRDLLLPGDAA